jgi:hypothetical protein
MTRFPAQGQVAPKIARSMAELDTLSPPPEIRTSIYLDKNGNLLPEWVQVARIYQRPVKRLAIVGFADTKVDAPYQDPATEIWGLNDLHNALPRYDRWFDIHPRDNIELDCTLMRNKGQTPPETIGLSGLRKLNVPVYMQDRYEDIPNSLKYPLNEMLAYWKQRSLTGYNYLTNSISEMIAFALYEGIVTGIQWETIGIYGVDMAVGSEYVDQRPSCEYWIGLAEGMGVKVYIPPASDLCHCRFMYAFEQKKEDLWQAKIDGMLKSMNERRNQIMQQEQQAHDARMQYEGGIGAIREANKVWANLNTPL